MKSQDLATNAQHMPAGIRRSDTPEETGESGPSLAEIRERALEIHVERDGIQGCHLDEFLDDWLQAERELREEYNKIS